MYDKVLPLSELVGSTAQRPRIGSGQRNRDNTPNRFSSTVLEANSGITFPGNNFSKSRFRKEKQAHYKLCVMAEIGKVLQQKWHHARQLPSTFESDLFRWTNYWKRQAGSDEVSATRLIDTC